MQLLILGGTRFVGRHIVEAFLAEGHAVTILTRGQTADDLPASVERLRGDRDAGVDGLTALADRSWDACVDVSGYTPRQVRPSAELLRDRVKRYVFISAVSVYGDPDLRPVLETHPLLPPAAEDVTEVNGETYGRLKVTCENTVQEIYGERGALLRPQIVAGPHDPSGRYTYWVNRAPRGGEVLAPGDGSDHVQVIDARDLARFVITVVENGLGGAFNMVGPRITWAEFMQALGAEHPVWVSTEILRASGLTFQEQLPMFRPEHGARSGLMDVSSEKAQAAGLILTDPAITVRDTRAWSLGANIPLALPPDREAELIRISRQG
jgi:2'-hydroxyisoflavone reductase